MDDKADPETTHDLKLKAVEKRLDDFKWFLGGLGGLLGLGFSVLVLVSSWNANAERTSLREFQKELKADVGKIEGPPDIVLLGQNGQELNGQEIQVPVSRISDGSPALAVGFRLLNRGDGLSGPLFLKFYTKYPVNSGSTGSDDPGWEFESYSTPDSIQPQQIPGKFSFNLTNRIPVLTAATLQGGRFPALIKVYFGKGKVAQAAVTLFVQGEEKLPPNAIPPSAVSEAAQDATTPTSPRVNK